MTISTMQYQNADSERKQHQLAEVMVELDNLKKQSERLDLANKLHARMAGVLSLTGMIEAYSVWLMPLVNHELIGYSNGSRQKRHLFCSGHGPHRRSAMAFAEQLIDDKSSLLGHQAGDEVLLTVVKVLKKAVRSTDLLVRMGGDEFLLVLDQTDRDSARILAERLCVAIDSLEIWANDTTKLGVSTGLSEMKNGENLQEWLERTDDILYHSKAKGRAMVSIDSID